MIDLVVGDIDFILIVFFHKKFKIFFFYKKGITKYSAWVKIDKILEFFIFLFLWALNLMLFLAFATACLLFHFNKFFFFFNFYLFYH